MHVAIVTFGYPPLAHVSSKRPAWMAKELVRAGLSVTVITVDWRAQASSPRSVEDAVDEALFDEGMCEVRIDPRRHYPAFDPLAIPRTTEPPPPANAALRRAHTLWRTLSWGPFPTWARDGFRALRLVHRERPLDVVWAIHGDDSAHEIAHRFRVATGVPWIADFKDPWDLFHVGIARAVQAVASHRRLSTAHALTETSVAQAASDASRFKLPASVVWSGYDSRAMECAIPADLGEGFSLSYFGGFSPQHDVDAVGRVLRRLESLSPEAHRKLRLHVWSSSTGSVETTLSRHSQLDCLVRHDFVPEEQAFGLMKGSGALLLLPATKFVPSGGSVGMKELEYFASGTPVLVLGRLIDEMQSVVANLPQVFQATDEDDAARFLLSLIGTPGAFGRGAVNAPSVAAHDWVTQAAKLKTALGAAVA